MKALKYYIILILCGCIFFFSAFVDDIEYYKITKEAVKFKIPKGFPKPVYDFKNNKITPAGFVLGRQLFYDPILSRDNSTSCASCHQRFAAFAHTDHKISHGVNGSIGKRNVPAIQNLIWQKNFMWDGGINHIEVQPIAPITNPVEMDESLERVIKKLQTDPKYVSKFKLAFGDTLVTTEKIMKALTQFMGLMISSNSRYDYYLKHQDTLSSSEHKGLKLFRENCSRCHTEPLFTNNAFEFNGLEMHKTLKDSGRIVITGVASDYMKFKVPSLRNVELTFPYMHDGRMKELSQVVRHYSKSNLVGVKQNMTEEEIKDIVEFLRTLTDRQFIFDQRFYNPYEKRKVQIIQEE